MVVNLLGLWKQKYGHHWQSVYLTFESKNMGAIGGQFTRPLEVAIFTPMTKNSITMLTCSSIMCCGLDYIIIAHLVKAVITFFLISPKGQVIDRQWCPSFCLDKNMDAIGSLRLKNSVIELTCSSIMCCWLDYVIIVHVVKAARSLNGLGLVIMPGKPAVQAGEPAMLIIAHTANE